MDVEQMMTERQAQRRAALKAHTMEALSVLPSKAGITAEQVAALAERQDWSNSTFVVAFTAAVRDGDIDIAYAVCEKD